MLSQLYRDGTPCHENNFLPLNCAKLTYISVGVNKNMFCLQPTFVLLCRPNTKRLYRRLCFSNSFLKSLTKLFSCIPMSWSLHLILLETSVSYPTYHSPYWILFPLYIWILYFLSDSTEGLSVLLLMEILLHLSFITRKAIAALS